MVFLEFYLKIFMPYHILKFYLRNISAFGNQTYFGNYNPSGHYEAHVDGIYHVCASVRVKEGSHGDYTVNTDIHPNGTFINGKDTILAAFGGDCPFICSW